jgi:hypothetical protein
LLSDNGQIVEYIAIRLVSLVHPPAVQGGLRALKLSPAVIRHTINPSQEIMITLGGGREKLLDWSQRQLAIAIAMS